MRYAMQALTPKLEPFQLIHLVERVVGYLDWMEERLELDDDSVAIGESGRILKQFLADSHRVFRLFVCRAATVSLVVVNPCFSDQNLVINTRSAGQPFSA
jgi:hypothetical protein